MGQLAALWLLNPVSPFSAHPPRFRQLGSNHSLFRLLNPIPPFSTYAPRFRQLGSNRSLFRLLNPVSPFSAHPPRFRQPKTSRSLSPVAEPNPASPNQWHRALALIGHRTRFRVAEPDEASRRPTQSNIIVSDVRGNRMIFALNSSDRWFWQAPNF